MRGPSRQAVSVVLTLAGAQDTEVAAQQPQTDGASVSVRFGRALIYLHDRTSVESYVRAWHSMSSAAAVLPRAMTHPIKPVNGMAEPAIVVDASGGVVSDGRMVGSGERMALRLLIGRLLFVVRDVPAFASMMLAFREADLLARETFLDSKVPTAAARRQAAENAAAAFRAPPAPQRSSAVPRPGPSASAVMRVRAELSPEWMR